MDTREQQDETADHTEAVEHSKRTHTIVAIEVLLRPEQINWFKRRLEDLKKEALNAHED